MPGHFCYKSPLSPKIPSNKKVLFIFYDIECIPSTRIGDSSAFLHERNLLCVEEFCSVCESESTRSEERDPLTRDRPIIIAIAHNESAYDLSFILDYAVKSGWLPDLVLKGAKILCMKMARGSVVVKALCCKPEGRGFKSRWGGFFKLT
jgi:hypothetical protein